MAIIIIIIIIITYAVTIWMNFGGFSEFGELTTITYTLITGRI